MVPMLIFSLVNYCVFVFYTMLSNGSEINVKLEIEEEKNHFGQDMNKTQFGLFDFLMNSI